jgi:hypothetical protein
MPFPPQDRLVRPHDLRLSISPVQTQKTFGTGIVKYRLFSPTPTPKPGSELRVHSSLSPVLGAVLPQRKIEVK